jgi:rRNA maturation protein Rpf1
MEITAIITNVIKDGLGIRVFYRFSDDDERARLFDLETNRDQIIQSIKTEIQEKKDHIRHVEEFQDLIGTEIL